MTSSRTRLHLSAVTPTSSCFVSFHVENNGDILILFYWWMSEGLLLLVLEPLFSPSGFRVRVRICFGLRMRVWGLPVSGVDVCFIGFSWISFGFGGFLLVFTWDSVCFGGILFCFCLFLWVYACFFVFFCVLVCFSGFQLFFMDFCWFSPRIQCVSVFQ